MIFFVNDKSLYNQRYRIEFIDMMRGAGIELESFGIFDSPFGILKFFILSLNRRHRFITSNLKTNIVLLCFIWVKGFIILNGLGRFRKKKFFRRVIIVLLKISSSRVSIQNYADYRYFRRLIPYKKFFWVPGSGGNKREVGTSDDFVVISRPNKIKIVEKSILSFIDLVGKDNHFYIVGCEKEGITGVLRNMSCVIALGYVNQEKIFISGRFFFQPSGYGEGIPHSLLDALCSRMIVYIHKRDFIMYGFKLLGFQFSEIKKGYGQICFNEHAIANISSLKISEQYFSISSSVIFTS